MGTIKQKRKRGRGPYLLGSEGHEGRTWVLLAEETGVLGLRLIFYDKARILGLLFEKNQYYNGIKQQPSESRNPDI
ncbi:hypothetical protein SAMN04490201_2026 [Pseudomonas psychrophila]|uniref:Transposase n=1 Tax=Pseudomonas psychrophila TaxID=122355 RepID=A0ABY0VQK5_9PSED|nr:hypothetical protein SAMN04490201_2026 [Pseudomonas psychrophila]